MCISDQVQIIRVARQVHRMSMVPRPLFTETQPWMVSEDLLFMMYGSSNCVQVFCESSPSTSIQNVRT